MNRRRCLEWENLNDGENAGEKSDHTDRNSGQRKVSLLSSGKAFLQTVLQICQKPADSK